MTIKLILNYLNYRLTAFNEHDVHSPFVYDFYMELIKNKNPFNDFEELNLIRSQLLTDETELNVTDFGAGSKKLNSTVREIKNITKNGIAQKKQAEFLYRLINKFSPKTIVELGTSVGLTTLYLAKPIKKSTVYTTEGCPEIYKFANQLILKSKVNNIKTRNGNFNIEFPKLLAEIENLDLLYVDGNHSYDATITYFKLALTKKNSQSIFVFDDINWSNDMQKAWKEIYSNKEVKLSLDFFYFGILFFRTEQKEKEHFVLKF
jgi:predicted O-methyltransferase YrrM